MLNKLKSLGALLNKVPAKVRLALFKTLSLVGLNTPARICIALSPFFIAASGYVVSLAARYLPGLPSLDPAEVDAVFITGATLAATKIFVWLQGAKAIDVEEAHARLYPSVAGNFPTFTQTIPGELGQIVPRPYDNEITKPDEIGDVPEVVAPDPEPVRTPEICNDAIMRPAEPVAPAPEPTPEPVSVMPYPEGVPPPAQPVPPVLTDTHRI